MPAFKGGKLSENEIKKLAVYVYKFGGGQADAPPVAAAEVTAAAAIAAVGTTAASAPVSVASKK